MNTTRTGKIARLPRHIRDQLNRRIHDGNQGKNLVAWLNTLPEVQHIMAADFAGKPIRPQNLSEWKHGGYRDWLLDQDTQELARQLAQDAADLQPRFPFAELLAHRMTARYALATCGLQALDSPEHWRRLRELCADVVQLRRGDHAAERLRLDRERHARDVQCSALVAAMQSALFHLPTRRKLHDWEAHSDPGTS